MLSFRLWSERFLKPRTWSSRSMVARKRLFASRYHAGAVGIDLHKDTMTICTLLSRCCGEIRLPKIACKNREQVVRVLRRPAAAAHRGHRGRRLLSLAVGTARADRREAGAGRCHPSSRFGRPAVQDRSRGRCERRRAVGRRPFAAGLCSAPGSADPPRLDAAPQPALAGARPGYCTASRALMNINNRPGPARLCRRGPDRLPEGLRQQLPERHVRMLWQHQRRLSLIEEEIGVWRARDAGCSTTQFGRRCT